MSYWRQPWHRLDKRTRLRELDPETAFDLERRIIESVGEDLLVTLAKPRAIATEVMRASDGGTGADAVAASLRALGRVLEGLLSRLELDPLFMAELFASTVLGRIEVDGVLVEDWAQWDLLGRDPLAKWTAIGAQLVNTYGPLWRRAPYKAGRPVDTYGVPDPDVPVARQWVSELAAQGRCGDPVDVLRSWTALDIIMAVEVAARAAEVSRRASEAARKGA